MGAGGGYPNLLGLLVFEALCGCLKLAALPSQGPLLRSLQALLGRISRCIDEGSIVWNFWNSQNVCGWVSGVHNVSRSPRLAFSLLSGNHGPNLALDLLQGLYVFVGTRFAHGWNLAHGAFATNVMDSAEKGT